MATRFHRIVIVGGGAGGLELAVRLARHGQRDVLLVDEGQSHVWKPRLHELAAGMRRGEVDALDYAGLAATWGFAFERGSLADIDPAARTVTLSALADRNRQTPMGERQIGYQALVLALGGVTPDMGTEGVLEHAFVLDRENDAEALFQRYSTGLLARANMADDKPYRIVVVGSGLTGVELSAHLITDAACADLAPASAAPDIQITILEAADTLMGGMNDQVRDAVCQRLHDIGIEMCTGKAVSKVFSESVETEAGESVPSDLTVWAVGRVGPPVADDIQALATNEKRQWRVRATLQTRDHDAIFAFGDCACLDDNPAPPTAQAASEQAEHLVAQLPRWLAGHAPTPFQFKDKGTLLSLGDGGTVGKVRGLCGNDQQVRGRLARAAYRGLQRQHQFRILGAARGAGAMCSDLFRRAGPQLKIY